MYADDIQLYITCDGDQAPTGMIEECVGEVRHWMRTNMLALNDRKTEVIHFSSKLYGQVTVPSCDLHVGGVSISPNAVCNLGVMLDLAGTPSNHVSKLCKSASFPLWKLSRIRTLSDQSTTLTLIHAFVTSRMDHCNSLLFGRPSREIKKIQIIQNSAVHLITKTKNMIM